MIRKIHRITSFGVFDDFTWPGGLHEFKQFNLLYGWNYSGKTTFSRAFRCFELLKRHPDFASAEVQFHCEGGKVHSLSATSGPHHYRVFNVDYIRENIFFDESDAEPILILGAADKAKQQEFKLKQDELSAIGQEIEAAKVSYSDIESGLERSLTISARDNIKIPLNRLNYDKTKFLAAVRACMGNPQNGLLSDLDYQQTFTAYSSTDKKDSLSSDFGVALTSLTTLADRVSEVCSRSVRSVTIQAVAEDPNLEKWVNEGRALHHGKASCQFCGKPLPPDLLSKLNNHFSTEYDRLMADLAEVEIALNRSKAQSLRLPQADSFYPDLAISFREIETRLKDLMSGRQASLDNLRNSTDAKKTKAFTPFTAPLITDEAHEINAALQAVSALVEAHNRRCRDFDKSREASFLKLERHWASTFVIDHEYNAKLQSINELKQAEREKKAAAQKLKETVAQLQQEISEAAKGAETINDLMRAYFGKDDLRISVADDKRFRITRNGSIAKNLSEGERSAIAFAHFMTKLFDEKYALNEMTVVVDDPICSLDANHLFNTYSFVKTKLSGCYQLFVLTHNYEFYSLLKEWALDDEKKHKDKDQSDWKKWSIYLVRRKDDGTSTIEVIPPELLKFRSEYHYLFATLLKFKAEIGSDYDYLYSLPNIARRFMEAFGGIMIPTFAGLHSKLNRIIPNEVERERVWKFINHYSHNNSVNRSLVIPDVSECRAVVDACLYAVEQWNTEYYKDLVSSVQ